MRIECKQLAKIFPGRVLGLAGLDLVVEPGQAVGLVGPSGCGKTTTLRLVAGLETPTSGSLFLDGKDMAGVSPWRRQVGMMFQTPAVFPHLNVRDNLAFGPRLQKGLSKVEVQKRVLETAELLHIESLLDRMPRQLSGGQIQRVALGRAIARRPKFLLLDEPLSQLDKPLRRQLREELHLLQRHLGTTMLYVTHDDDELPGLVDHVVHLELGRRVREVLLSTHPREVLS